MIPSQLAVAAVQLPHLRVLKNAHVGTVGGRRRRKVATSTTTATTEGNVTDTGVT